MKLNKIGTHKIFRKCFNFRIVSGAFDHLFPEVSIGRELTFTPFPLTDLRLFGCISESGFGILMVQISHDSHTTFECFFGAVFREEKLFGIHWGKECGEASMVCLDQTIAKC